MALKAIYDKNGNVVDFVEETDEIESIMAAETDTYFDDAIPENHRKLRKDKTKEESAEQKIKIAVLIVGPILILFLIYYIIVTLI